MSLIERYSKATILGWQLGSDPDIQVPNVVSNHLTTGLLTYIRTTGRYASGINLLERLTSREPEISSLLAQVLISGDEEVKAVKLLHQAIQVLPMDYSLLDTQATFCSKKGRNDIALEIAKRSVISAPSEFGTWARLAEIYITLEQWDLALLTLNSCPMFTYQDKDAPRSVQPEKINLPVLPESLCDEIDDANAANEPDMVHPTLRKLVAATYKGTFQKAYMLLTEITKKIGWDQLLRIRSQVFVMEEEYRHERTDKGRSVSVSGAPVASNALTTNGNGVSSSTDGTLAKPHPSTTSSSTDDSSTTAATSVTPPIDPSHTAYTAFLHKRLCERWLDNLFMVLYEDLRVYTIWRTEATQSRTQQLQYRKSADEWEVLGDLARRLHYEREAEEAWAQCLAVRFSPKAMFGVMRARERERDAKGVVAALIRLVCWQYRWYSEVCSPIRPHSSFRGSGSGYRDRMKADEMLV